MPREIKCSACGQVLWIPDGATPVPLVCPRCQAAQSGPTAEARSSPGRVSARGEQNSALSDIGRDTNVVRWLLLILTGLAILGYFAGSGGLFFTAYIILLMVVDVVVFRQIGRWILPAFEIQKGEGLITQVFKAVASLVLFLGLLIAGVIFFVVACTGLEFNLP